MNSKKKFIFFIFTVLSILNINSAYSMEPDVFIQSTINRAHQALNDKFTKEEKIEKLKLIAKDTVDIKGIGFYTLGSYRKTINKDQKEMYISLFEQYFLKTFSSRLAEYSNPEIQVNSKSVLNENYTMVSSILVSTEQRPEVKINWRVYTKDPKNPKIRDLIIEGLSLARTQKEEFSSIIESNDGDINALFAVLREFIK
jgi:phospholipid transport system substrate-binding protein